MIMTLKAIRTNLKMKQDEAAVLIGVEPRTLSSWENAKTFPNVPQIRKIEEVYGVNYSDINFLV